MSPKRTSAPSGFELSALTATWSPGVRSTAPRARGALLVLKNAAGRAWGAANWSGTASQSISRRPPRWPPGAPPWLAPSSRRNLTRAGERLPAPRTTFGNAARRAELPGSEAAAAMTATRASVDRAVAMRSIERGDSLRAAWSRSSRDRGLLDGQHRAVAPAALGPVEGGVGALDQVHGLLGSGPGRQAGRDRLVVRGDRAQALDERGGGLGPAVREQHRELLASVAGQQVAGAELCLPRLRRLAQAAVARRMAVAVVELLEPVEVED